MGESRRRSCPALAVAVVVVILLNAAFAIAQERQAERAVEALAGLLPATAVAVRDGTPVETPAADLVPGDVIVLSEGDRISADAPLARRHGGGGPVGAQR